MEKQLKKRLKLKWTTFIIMHFVYGETSAFVLEHTKWRPGSFTKLGNERCLETSMVLAESGVPGREERVHWVHTKMLNLINNEIVYPI